MTEEDEYQEHLDLHEDVADEIKALLADRLPEASCQTDVLLSLVHGILQSMTDAEDVAEVMNNIGLIALSRMSTDAMLMNNSAGNA